MILIRGTFIYIYISLDQYITTVWTNNYRNMDIIYAYMYSMYIIYNPTQNIVKDTYIQKLR